MPVAAQQQEPAEDRWQAALLEVLGKQASTGEPLTPTPELEDALLGLREATNTDPLRETRRWREALARRPLSSTLLRRPGKLQELFVRDGRFANDGWSVALRVPKVKRGSERRFPLIVSLHDVEEKAAAHLRTAWSDPALWSQAIFVTPQLAGDPDTWQQIAVDGQLAGLPRVLNTLRACLRELPVDPDRVFVVGHGAGVPVGLAAASYSPERFAAAVGRAGDPGGVPPDHLTNLPVLLIGGGVAADQLVEQAVALGGAWQAHASMDDTDLWNWLGEQRRDPLPTQVSVRTGPRFPAPRNYWLEIAPVATGAWGQAQIDRATGTITVRAEGVARLTLHLNDDMLPLDQPIRVALGESTKEVYVERELGVLLDALQAGRSDAGFVYTAAVTLQVDFGQLTVAAAHSEDPDPEFAAHWQEAGEDPDKLWLVFEWAAVNGRASKQPQILRRLLRVAPNHRKAREALGHYWGSGPQGEQWYTGSANWEREQQSQSEAEARSRGWVLHQGRWMHPADRKRAKGGTYQDSETGLWVTRSDQKRLAAGWQRQDTEWVSPEEWPQWEAGLWRAGGRWMTLAEANRYHESLDRMWVIPDAEIRLHTTVERSVALTALWHMRFAMEDLRKVFGVQPPGPLPVALLRNQEQYDRLAIGAPDGSRVAAHSGHRYHVHHAYFTDRRFVRLGRKRTFEGLGVGYWEAFAPNGAAYGVHSARLAVGLAYGEALDPSPETTSKMRAEDAWPSDYTEAYEAEKRLPAWLRLGGAVYAERYFEDPTVQPVATEQAESGATPNGDTAPDPFWARQWTLQNLAGRGGLRPLEEFFTHRWDPTDAADGQRWLMEAGGLVSFLVDGPCEPARAAHQAFRAAWAEDRLRKEHWQALELALRTHEDELRAYLAP